MNVSEHVIVTCYSNRLFVSWKEYLMFPVCTTDPMLVAAESFQEELAGQSQQGSLKKVGGLLNRLTLAKNRPQVVCRRLLRGCKKHLTRRLSLLELRKVNFPRTVKMTLVFYIDILL